MKSLLVLLSAFLLYTPFIAAQKIGFKAGINFNNAHIANEPDGFDSQFKTHVGFHAGVNYTFRLSDRFSLMPELQFIKKGFRVEDDPTYNIYNGRVILNYVELPVIFSIRFLKIFHGDLGPSIAYKLSARGKSDNFSNDASKLYNEDFDWGLNGGIHVDIGNNFSIVSRYYFGMSSIAPGLFFTEDGVTGESSTMQNRNLQLALVYKLSRKQ